MSAHSLPVLLMFGVSLYAGIFHLLFFINKKENRENLYFALICFSIAFYDVMCFGLYNAHSVMNGIGWQRGQYFAICCLVISFLYFAFALTEKKSTWLARIIGFFMYLMIAAGLLFPNLIWDLQAPRIKKVTVFNLHIAYFEAGSAALISIVFALTIAASIYIFYIQYGHPVGDKIIKNVAEELLSSSRNYDVKARYSQEKKEATVPSIRKYDVAGRYGGDEFAVLLPYCSEIETKIIAERIRKHVNNIKLEDTPDLKISVSMGGVVFDQKVLCDEEGILILQADQALYQAKQSGRNQVVINSFRGKL